MAGLGGGGIGRFARKKQQQQPLSQQDATAGATAATATADSSQGDGDGRPNGNNATEFDTAATLAGMKIAPTTNGTGNVAAAAVGGTTNDDDDRPETPFASFAANTFECHSKPSSAGGGFSAIDQMFDAMQYDNDIIDNGANDDNDDVRNLSMEGMFVDAAMTANADGNENLEANFGQQGFDDCDGFRGFNSFDDGMNVGEEQMQLMEPQVHNDANKANGANSKSPPTQSPTAAAAAAAAAANSTATDIGRRDVSQGGGIGLFAKKRSTEVPAAPTTTVTSPNDLRENPSLQQTTNDNVVVGTMSSVADLSRYDTDLVSAKNAESSDAILVTMNPPSPPDASGGVVVPDLNRNQGGVEEVPKTIPMSGNDDIEDDLTVGTTVEDGNVVAAVADGGVVVVEHERPSVPTMSPYFANSWNNATDTTSKTDELMEKSKSATVQGGGDIKLSNHSSSLAPRVSLSPPPPGDLNVPRPSSNNNMIQAAYFPPTDHMDCNVDVDDDNSIVIPGVPASVANMNVDGMRATSGTTVGGFGLRSVNQAESTNRNSQSNMRASVERVVPTTLLNSQMSRPTSATKATTQSALDHSSTTINSRGIGKFASRTEKVKFTSAATNDPNGSNTNTSFKKSKVASFGAPLANSKDSMATSTTLNSTAITPDHRQGIVQDFTTTTPYSHCTNGNHSGAITPTPHKGPALASTPDAAPTTATDFQPMAMEVEPKIKQTAEAPPPPRGRPRSQTIYSPTPSTTAESVTPKACNVAMNPTTTAAPSSSNECFDDLLSEFVTYIQEGADIYERGQSDLLELEVDLSHAFAAVLRYKDEYTTLLSEIECVQARAEHIMSEVSK